MSSLLKKGSVIDLEVESLAFGAKGLARENGYVIFVDQGIPGQRVRVKITKKRKGYAHARPLEVLRQSGNYVEPRCRHFEDCGGCLLQSLRYDTQLAAKERQITELLEHIGGFIAPPVAPIIGSDQQFFYRNKMEFSFSRQRWLTKAEVASEAVASDREFALGLHGRNCYDKFKWGKHRETDEVCPFFTPKNPQRGVKRSAEAAAVSQELDSALAPCCGAGPTRRRWGRNRYEPGVQP